MEQLNNKKTIKTNKNPLKRATKKINFYYNEALLNQAHHLFKTDPFKERWNLTKIISIELQIEYNTYTKSKKPTLQARFNLWNPIYRDKNGNSTPKKATVTTLLLSQFTIHQYNEMFLYFSTIYKRKITKYMFNNYLLNRFLTELMKDYSKGGKRYKNYLKPKEFFKQFNKN